jgi:hypothetical protein
MVTALQPTAGRQINSTTKTYQTTDRLLTNPLAFGQRKLHAKLDTSLFKLHPREIFQWPVFSLKKRFLIRTGRADLVFPTTRSAKGKK